MLRHRTLLAPAFADLPGLVSKTWLADEETNTYGGVPEQKGEMGMLGSKTEKPAKSMRPRIRLFDDRDADAVIGLSLRAWAPVFASLERVLGSAIFRRQHPDWRVDQRRAVEEVCATKKGRVWVAEVDGSVVGFVAVELHSPERNMGEVYMLAVDPDHQGGGIGTALTEFALERLKDA
ncbi:MAG: GNAT family N-acetyltransferase, partial [Rubrobacter sp.]